MPVEWTFENKTDLSVVLQFKVLQLLSIFITSALHLTTQISSDFFMRMEGRMSLPSQDSPMTGSVTTPVTTHFYTKPQFVKNNK